MIRVLTVACVGLALSAVAIVSGCGLEPGGGTGPRIAAYSDSGCLAGTPEDKSRALSGSRDATEEYPGCGEDDVELTVGGTTLNVVHRNATYNCCPDDIAFIVAVGGDVITITETEILTAGGCDCLCCYDTEATVVDLASGEYTVRFCWDDHETSGEECHVEDIVIE